MNDESQGASGANRDGLAAVAIIVLAAALIAMLVSQIV